MPTFPQPPDWVLRQLGAGLVIPAHPLALTASRRLDERHQRALTRYYHAAGAGGLAVGVHTTQFAIRRPEHDLFRPVLQLAAETVSACDAVTGRQTVRIAGICGPTAQAAAEAEVARDLGYQAGLLSLGALAAATDDALLAHCEAVAQIIPLFGFYLQPAAGGRRLSYGFWRRFAEIPNAVAIKVAPFNRYQTLDVLRAVADSGRARHIALYTGNDDHIVLDLVGGLPERGFQPASDAGHRTASGLSSASDRPAPGPSAGDCSATAGPCSVHFVGGLLGHWACWTRKAVELLARCHDARRRGAVSAELLAVAEQVTDANAALFDPAHDFAGCIPGIHTVLHRQGLLSNTLCLDPDERLSPGQAGELDRVCTAYPHLTDDEFVATHLDEWLS